MATRLFPYQNSKNKTRNSMKLNINCNERIEKNPVTKDWLELTKKFDHTSDYFKIYTGLLDKRNSIVAKIGPNKLEEEYATAKKLTLPTFISFNCIFKCLDDFSKLNSLTREVCKKEGEPITVIIMPYMTEGRIDFWQWDRSKFSLMKNIIKHVFLSLIYSKNTLGFIHRDLHLGNVLMKKSKRKEISYGDFGTLEVMGFLPVIMDFEKSHFIENYDRITYEDLNNFLSLMSSQCDVKFDCHIIVKFLEKLVIEERIISVNDSNKIMDYIDNLQIRYVNSEVPPLPDWLKPQKV